MLAFATEKNLLNLELQQTILFLVFVPKLYLWDCEFQYFAFPQIQIMGNALWLSPSFPVFLSWGLIIYDKLVNGFEWFALFIQFFLPLMEFIIVLAR